MNYCTWCKHCYHTESFLEDGSCYCERHDFQMDYKYKCDDYEEKKDLS